MRVGALEFREVVACDAEFFVAPGEPPHPLCLVARELSSGRTFTLGEDDLRRHARPPYATGSDVLFVGYYVSAELGCYLALGWPLPERVLDLYVEFRNLTNGRPTVAGNGLLGALAHLGLDVMDAVEKENMRALALRGGPRTDAEQQDLLRYCMGDVAATEQLFSRMLPMLDIERALLRGQFMSSAARIEACGVPIDAPALAILRNTWDRLPDRLIERIDADYGVYEGRTFKETRWGWWCDGYGLPWPHLPSGRLALDKDTFREMARRCPAVAPMQELRATLSQLRLEDLAVGRDGRNRYLLSPFRAKTGRNQPSASQSIFGPAVWLRGLIRPQPDTALAYIDWSQQEFGIAAALSGDAVMLAAYESGDPYLAFAMQAGAIPAHATKATHGPLRELFKTCALAVQYGMGPGGLATRIGKGIAAAQELLRLHRITYPRFWRWSDAAVDHAYLYNQLRTVFGWTLHLGPDTNPRSLRNFPMQANGAEMLRVAAAWRSTVAFRSAPRCTTRS